jgi:hypothetical protein
VRDVALWLSGAALAFFLTAGAFLLLANLATIPADKSLAPDPAQDGPGAAVELELDAEQLASLRPQQDQSLDLAVKNEGSRPLSDVNVTLNVSSENTALSDIRYYRQTVGTVADGGRAEVRFSFDLSEPEQRVTGQPASEPARELLEFKATTPGGISTAKTVVLPP